MAQRGDKGRAVDNTTAKDGRGAAISPVPKARLWPVHLESGP